MLRDYVATVPRVTPEALSASSVAQIGAPQLAAMLLEWAKTDPRLHQRLKDALENGNQINRVEFPRTAEGEASLRKQIDESEAKAGRGYMVGCSPVMRHLFEAIRKYAVTAAPVLITGESGTGKELAARAIHERSSVAKGPFVAINCCALPTTLIASELFGYEKGAFTGANARKLGRIESAEGGTVFLDEIGDLPLETQAHLLRFLQEKTVERVGGFKSLTVNARVVAATNVNLDDAVAKGRFREDLFYRLNVLTLEMPPLRARGDDIALLAKFFLQQFAEEMGRPTVAFAPEAEAALLAHRWPGNVRELIACIRRAVVMSDGSVIQARDLALSQSRPVPAGSEKGLGEARAETEATVIRGTLERNRFNIKQSARELGVSRVTLYRLIQRHDIKIERPGRQA